MLMLYLHTQYSIERTLNLKVVRKFSTSCLRN